MSPNKDKTGNDRQRRRRQREKAWLKEHGIKSWEALHTALINGKVDELIDLYIVSHKNQFEILSKEVIARNAYIAGFLSTTSLTQRPPDVGQAGQ